MTVKPLSKNTRKYKRFGKTVVDAANSLAVRIRPTDITKAVCRDHQRCVIANAITRSQKAPWVDVGPNTVFVGVTEKLGHRYQLDAVGREMVRFFDENDGAAGPGLIVLRAPSPSAKIGARIGKNDGGPKRKKSKRRKPTR